MRKAETTTDELQAQLKAEKERFKGLDALKIAMWNSLGTENIQEWELLKAQWQDSAEEITHIHRKLYPYFPRGLPCPNCGADTTPVAGSNAKIDSCIACGTMSDRWSL